MRSRALFAALALVFACGPRGSADDVDAVTRLATEFLSALDTDPSGTWRELAESLCARGVPEAQWPAQIAQMRAPLRRPITRGLASAAFTEESERAAG
jgi:hypothetical protein